MKKLYFLSIVFIFLVQVSAVQGQQVVRKYFTHTGVDGTQVFKKYEYKYDAGGHVVEEVLLQKETAASFFEFKTKKEWSYQQDELLVYSIWEWSTLKNEWKTKAKYESIYDGAGCLSQQIKTVWSALGVEDVNKFGFKNDYDCTLGWKNKNYWFLNDFVPATKVSRMKTDSSELQIFSIMKDADLLETGRQEMVCNTDGQLLRYYNTYTNSAHGHLYSYNYNEDGQVIKRRWFTKEKPDENWSQKSKTVTEYTYDLESLLQKRVRINEYHNGNIYTTQLFIYDYSYYCDGLLKEKKWTNEHQTEHNSTIYEYAEPADCGYHYTALKIYPNPFENKIFVEGSLLNEIGAVINIYNMDGELIRKKTLSDRLDKAEIEIDGYSEEVLILQIQTKNQRISRKILKMN